MVYTLTEENFGINSSYKEIMRLRIENARLKGEFIGFCRALTYWEIPEELKTKINEQIKRLEDENKTIKKD